MLLHRKALIARGDYFGSAGCIGITLIGRLRFSQNQTSGNIDLDSLLEQQFITRYFSAYEKIHIHGLLSLGGKNTSSSRLSLLLVFARPLQTPHVSTDNVNPVTFADSIRGAPIRVLLLMPQRFLCLSTNQISWQRWQHCLLGVWSDGGRHKSASREPKALQLNPRGRSRMP